LLPGTGSGRGAGDDRRSGGALRPVHGVSRVARMTGMARHAARPLRMPALRVRPLCRPLYRSLNRLLHRLPLNARMSGVTGLCRITGVSRVLPRSLPGHRLKRPLRMPGAPLRRAGTVPGGLR
jgi:hypothetical protein